MKKTNTILKSMRMLTMTERTLDDVYTYTKQALDSLSPNHPHYNEIKQLLVSQINDELEDYANTITD